jgi:hypothetical protein
MTQRTEEKQIEIQEEEQEDALESLLSKVDMSSPLEIPLDNGQIFSISQEQFISYWLPKDATREEKAKCFNETRAAGLNPAIKGDCFYFRTGDSPLGLFVGYHVYVRKAYANGLNHIHRPELIYDEETGKLSSCIITLEIEGRPDMVWETWYDEVEGQTRGDANKRWIKAPRQMLIKCSITNTLRLSGIATLGILPPAVEEMPDFPAPGYRTLTEGQLDRWKGAPQAMIDKQEFAEKDWHSMFSVERDAEIGEVSAENHQVDMSAFRRTYFKALEKRNILQDKTERRNMQEEKTGKRHTGDWGPEEYAIMMDWIHGIQGDPFIKEQMEKAKAMGVPKAVTDIIEGTQNATDEADHPDTQEEQEEEQDGGKESTERGDTACERLAHVLCVDAKDLSDWSSTYYKTPEKALDAFIAALNDKLNDEQILNDISAKFTAWKARQGSDTEEVQMDLANEPIE